MSKYFTLFVFSTRGRARLESRDTPKGTPKGNTHSSFEMGHGTEAKAGFTFYKQKQMP